MKSPIAALLVFVAFFGCKTEEKIVPDPQTAEDLKECRERSEQQKTFIETLEKENAELKLASGGDVTVTIEGDLLEIKAGGGSLGKATGRKLSEEDEKNLYDAFVKAVKRSRGAMTKCYQNALKKNSSLQARTVRLEIQVSYKAAGKVQDARFSPRISDTFNACMRGVTKNWDLPEIGARVSFATKLALTPQ